MRKGAETTAQHVVWGLASNSTAGAGGAATCSTGTVTAGQSVSVVLEAPGSWTREAG